MAKKKKNKKVSVVILPVRGDHVYLAEPDTGHVNSTGKYGMSILIDKDDEETMGELVEAFCAVAEVDDINDIGKHPFLNKYLKWRDGDLVERDGYENKWFLKATSKFNVNCYMLDEQNERVAVLEADTISHEFYNGAWYMVALDVTTWDSDEFDNAVTVYLNEVTKIKDDTPLSPAAREIASASQAKLAKLGMLAGGGGGAKKAEKEKSAPVAAKKRKSLSDLVG